MVRCSAHEGQPSGILKAFPAFQELEGDEPLVVVESQDAVGPGVLAGAEEPICGKGPANEETFCAEFLQEGVSQVCSSLTRGGRRRLRGD